MVRTLDDDEVVRLIKKHCSAEATSFFRRTIAAKPALVALILNHEIRRGPYPETEIIQRLKRVIWLMKKIGDA
jgi:hypothetical protein